MKSIYELNKVDRPLYKANEKGLSALKNDELLQIILGEEFPDVRRISKRILANKAEFSINNAALMELSIRLAGTDKKEKITSQDDAYCALKRITRLNQEHFVVITLDGASNIIRNETVFIGTLNQSLVHPREVFAPAIEDRAAGIIIAHNHPSGTLKPSRADIAITQRLQESAKLLGIELLDHMIVTQDGYYSFADEGLI